MPKFSSVDVLFKRTPEGWTFNSSYPRIFGRPSIYLLTDAQKAALEERLNRVMLMVLVLVCMLVVLCVVVLFIMVPDFAHRLDAGSLGAWFLLCVVSIVLTTAVILPAILFARHRVVRPVLGAARRIGPAQPEQPGTKSSRTRKESPPRP
jgi:polyferredoxin